MKITNIVNWLTNQNIKRGTKGFLIDCSIIDIPHATAVLLCKKTNQPTFVIGNIKKLSELDLFKSWEKSFFIELYPSDEFKTSSEVAVWAKSSNLLVVSPYSSIDLNVVRPWEHFCFIVDVLPFGNLTNEEIEDIYIKLTDDKSINKLNYKSSTFLDISYEEIKWAVDISSKQIKFKDILVAEKDPSKHPFWYSFTSRQKQILALLHQHIKTTEHKVVSKPVYKGE